MVAFLYSLGRQQISQQISASAETADMCRFPKALLLGEVMMLRPLTRALVLLQERNSLQQNENGLVDTPRSCSFYSPSSGVLITLIGQEGIRCAAPFPRQGKSGAAPATVGGESFSHMPLGLAMQGLGRRRRVTTREPGDLPERRHPSGVRGARSGRTSAAVTKRFVTRMEAATTNQPFCYFLRCWPPRQRARCRRMRTLPR